MDTEQHQGIQEYGDTTGKPVFYFHGSPGSRLECAYHEMGLKECGIRLIALDRPGYGQSPIQDKWTPDVFAENIAQIADQFGITKFSLIGFSGGGLTAMACAHRYPQLVDQLILVSTIVPPDINGYKDLVSPLILKTAMAIQNAPDVLEQQLTHMMSTPEAVMDILVTSASKPDQDLFNNRALYTCYQQAITESVNQGPKGYIRDMENNTGPWSFTPSDIKARTQIWHGKQDQTFSYQLAESLAAAIPDSSCHLVSDQGHFLTYSIWREIVSSLSK